MTAVKVLGMIFLGVYLVLMGLTSLSGMQLSMIANDLIQLIGTAAGVLILIAMKQFAKEK